VGPTQDKWRTTSGHALRLAGRINSRRSAVETVSAGWFDRGVPAPAKGVVCPLVFRQAVK
jgi:hypothetical protein